MRHRPKGTSVSALHGAGRCWTCAAHPIFPAAGVTNLDLICEMGLVENAQSDVIGCAMPQGHILGFAPPLCLTKQEADIVVDNTSAAIRQVFAAA